MKDLNDKKPVRDKMNEPKLEPKVAVNPDPRANANVQNTETTKTSEGAGSEITDGEGG